MPYMDGLSHLSRWLRLFSTKIVNCSELVVEILCVVLTYFTHCPYDQTINPYHQEGSASVSTPEAQQFIIFQWLGSCERFPTYSSY